MAPLSLFTGVPPHLRSGMRASGHASPSSKAVAGSASSANAAAEMAKMLAEAREDNRKLQVCLSVILKCLEH